MVELPKTATLVVPGGVVGTGGGDVLPPPPPHDSKAHPNVSAKIATITCRFLDLAATKVTPKIPNTSVAKTGPEPVAFGSAGGWANPAAGPAVWMTRVEVTGELPTVTIAGVNVQVESAGTLLHESDTEELNPATADTEIVIVVDCPARTLAALGCVVRAKSATLSDVA